MDLQLEMEPANLQVELGQVKSVGNPLVLQLGQHETCPWPCLVGGRGTLVGTENWVCVEKQVREPDPYQSDDDGDGDGGDDDAPSEVAEQD